MGALVIKPQQKAILEQLSRFARVQTPLSMSCRADGTAFIKRVLDNFGSLAIALKAVQQHFHEPGNFFDDATSLPRQHLESRLLLALSYEHPELETMLLAVKHLNDSGTSFHPKAKATDGCLSAAFSDPLDNSRSHKAIFDSTPDEHKPRLFDESFKPTHDLALLLKVYPEQIKAVFNALFKVETYDGHRLVMAMEMLRSSADAEVAALFKHYQHHCNELHLAAEDPRRAILWGETPSIEECQDRLDCVLNSLLASPLPIPDPQLLVQRFIDLAQETPNLNDEALAYIMYANCALHNSSFCALESYPERIVVLQSLIRYFTKRSVRVERLLVELDVPPPPDQITDLRDLIQNRQGLSHEYVIKYLLGGIGDQASYKFRESAFLAIVVSSTATEVLHAVDFNDEQLLKLYRLTGDTVFRDRLTLDHTREAALQHDLGM